MHKTQQHEPYYAGARQYVWRIITKKLQLIQILLFSIDLDIQQAQIARGAILWHERVRDHMGSIVIS